MASRDDSARAARHDDDVKVRALTDQISFLEEEVAALRGKLAEMPRPSRLLEERLAQTESALASVTGQNERLAATLREARDQIVALKEEVDRLAQPPNGFGIFLGANEDGSADVFTGGRKMRVTVSPSIEINGLRPGQELVLNEALNVVVALGYETVGEVVMLKELLDGGDRALVISHADEERIVRLAEPLLSGTLRAGDALLLEPRSGYVYERIPKSEVEELILEEVPDISYSQIGGLGPQIEQIRDAIELPYLHADLFREHQLRPPKGVLLYGPPGTGKTLLARAVAGEAGVPFFSISGSDFVEMFVGVGASRVRDMFEQAKKHAPCIIFIDEIDAVGRHRGAGLGGGHDEREQTLNQLLVEMDGFEGNEGIIVIAATNRPDVLDPALLRPGRFDRQVVVPLPDVRGREQILRVHMRRVPLGDDVKPALIARGTPGFSGADLANLVNEAALFAARANKRIVGMDEFERAKDKIMMGAERRSMVMTEEEKRMTAYHEAGHAIVAMTVPEHDPVYKVTIIPRGRALGLTQFLPEQDRYSMSKRRLESTIATLFGGRVAEELIFGPEAVTTGASNDIERATELARNMVTKWGLSDKLGPLTYTEETGEVFLGRSVTQHKQVSDVTAHAIDEEVRRVIEGNYKRAREILTATLDKLHAMAETLIKYETIEDEQLKDIMAGRTPKPPSGWDDSISHRPPMPPGPLPGAPLGSPAG